MKTQYHEETMSARLSVTAWKALKELQARDIKETGIATPYTAIASRIIIEAARKASK